MGDRIERGKSVLRVSFFDVREESNLEKRNKVFLLCFVWIFGFLSKCEC